MCRQGNDIQNNESIVERITVGDANSLRLLRRDVTLHEIRREKILPNVVCVQGAVALYSVHMGMNKRREALCYYEQNQGKGVKRNFHGTANSSTAYYICRICHVGYGV